MRDIAQQHALAQEQNVLAAIRELEDVVGEQRRLDDRRTALVAAARAYGASWSSIAGVLGTSKQAAWERYGGIAG